jgi:hypothetical protein
MTPQERDLISALLARLQQQSGKPRDPEADALIREAGAQIPDALYLLVQTVLIQDMALHDAQNRIAELERARDGAASQNEAAPSFLPPRASGAAPGSVPSAGRWSNTASGAAPLREPAWSQTAPASAAQPVAPPPYGYGPGPGYGPKMLAGGGSDFLRQAAATAAGVVGGSLLFQGLHSMFAPSLGSGFLAGTPMQPGLSETVINNYYNDDRGGHDHGTQQADATQSDAGDQAGVIPADYADDDDIDVGNDDGGNYDV